MGLRVLVPRASESARNTPPSVGRCRTLVAIGGALAVGVLAACGQAPQVALMQTSVEVPPEPEPEVPPADALSIGPGAVDTTGGWLPDGTMISPFDTANPILSQLDPALLQAVQDAARAAEAQGVPLMVTSGWRSRGFQQRLFDNAVQTYGSVDAAAALVATPEVSRHVTGQAIDIGPVEADRWLIANGRQFGLCQIYANEIWHFELAADVNGTCPPLLPNAAG